MQNLDPNQARISKFSTPLIATVVVLALTSVAGSLYFLSSDNPPKKAMLAADNRPIIKAITALGRIEPQGEVIQLSVSQMAGSNRVAQLFVKEGDRIQQGQMIAILDSSDRRLAALNQAKQQVKVAESRLAQVKAGAKQGEIAAQKATITELEALLRQESAARVATVKRLEAEVKNAELEYQRYQSLQSEGAVSTSIRDTKKLTLETAQASLREAIANQYQTSETLREKLKQATATLNRIAEIRPTDLQAAIAEIESAEASVKEAEADLNLTYVRSPKDGQILKIHSWTGEVVTDKGIVEIGETNQMYVVAEVYENDINKVKLGQEATINQLNLPGELKGKVDYIGLLIAKKDVLNTDPAADIDARVVEVKIRLNPESSKRVTGLTNSKVKVAINLQPANFR
ncbi:ABC exporter membrane fusion protein [Trichormus variabilis]|uniref:Hemolysin D n=1 Tax=Trichormus variabilis SAG 1403-4b TaxID=447716 RepID=A0A433UG33_ANAVA|nr:ABC exporter membrane fusion protein [Trichormus variabilis]MBD2627011.1 ABC exporter membrane fusion protein [Trichormus variabilis FACHB-164]RUS92764.1 hemolysin D [Trichormus variabilis SAG 1403-4b]